MSFDAIRKNIIRAKISNIYSTQLWSESQESKPHAYSTDQLRKPRVLTPLRKERSGVSTLGLPRCDAPTDDQH